MPDDQRQKLFQFQADLKKIAAEMDTAIEVVFGHVALQLFTKIVEFTPVDTGRLRAGWAVSLGEASDWLPPEVQSKTTGVAPEFSNPPSFPDLDIKLDQPIFIINNLVYAEAIEYGHSTKKAPLGMVRPAILAVEAELGV